MLINVKMPTIVDILTYEHDNFILSCGEDEKSFITSWPDQVSKVYQQRTKVTASKRRISDMHACIECQTVWIQIRTDMSVLIWV